MDSEIYQSTVINVRNNGFFLNQLTSSQIVTVPSSHPLHANQNPDFLNMTNSTPSAMFDDVTMQSSQQKFSSYQGDFITIQGLTSTDLPTVGLPYSPEPNVIQLWNCGRLNSSEVPNTPPVFSLGICHNHGCVLSMKFNPHIQAEQPLLSPPNLDGIPTYQRLGLLAVATTQTLRVYPIPHPQHFAVGSFVHLCMSIPLHLPPNVQIWDLDWSFHRHGLLVCCSNSGSVFIYDVTTALMDINTSLPPFMKKPPANLHQTETSAMAQFQSPLNSIPPLVSQYPDFKGITFTSTNSIVSIIPPKSTMNPPLFSIPVSSHPLRSVKFSPMNANIIATGGSEGKLFVFSLDTPGLSIQSTTLCQNWIMSITWSLHPSAKEEIYVGLEDHTIRIVELNIRQAKVDTVITKALPPAQEQQSAQTDGDGQSPSIIDTLLPQKKKRQMSTDTVDLPHLPTGEELADGIVHPAPAFHVPSTSFIFRPTYPASRASRSSILPVSLREMKYSQRAVSQAHLFDVLDSACMCLGINIVNGWTLCATASGRVLLFTQFDPHTLKWTIIELMHTTLIPTHHLAPLLVPFSGTLPTQTEGTDPLRLSRQDQTDMDRLSMDGEREIKEKQKGDDDAFSEDDSSDQSPLPLSIAPPLSPATSVNQGKLNERDDALMTQLPLGFASSDYFQSVSYVPMNLSAPILSYSFPFYSQAVKTTRTRSMSNKVAKKKGRTSTRTQQGGGAIGDEMGFDQGHVHMSLAPQLPATSLYIPPRIVSVNTVTWDDYCVNDLAWCAFGCQNGIVRLMRITTSNSQET
ncbi:hypothetical protein BLNAU_3706 [Blattamonas nauphoetae]|uniref:Uncharacterized protein n=1 Tax=Blattamonas nauphoetae TaxID=2049346 RepID=A0ABQ9YC11_9EUKA|nr:hypothetical protein BLNAU_3706 [Blattamonas nauphoetae]